MADTILLDKPKQAKQSTEYYARIGKLGGIVCKERHGTPHYRKIGAVGGQATRARHGSEFYARIGRKGNRAAYERWLATKKAGVEHG